MTRLEFFHKLRWIIFTLISQWWMLYDQWSKNLWLLETPLSSVLLLLDVAICFIFYTITKSGCFFSETPYNEKNILEKNFRNLVLGHSARHLAKYRRRPQKLKVLQIHLLY